MKRYLYLLIALIFLILAGVTYLLFEKNSLGASDEHYISALQKQVQKEIAKSKLELTEVGTVFQKAQDTLFTSLAISTKYPFYIFQNGKLIYWSSNIYIPDYQLISQIKDTDLLATNNAKFIVNRLQLTKQNKQISIFSLIPIYQKFRNENDYLKTGYNPKIFSTDPQSLVKSTNLKGFQAIQLGDNNGQTLFSILPPKRDINAKIPLNTLIFLGFSLLFLGIYLLTLIKILHSKKQFGRAFLAISVYLILLRLAMIYTNIPTIFVDSNIFNPTYFSANYTTPSLGDLLLNLVVCCFLLRYLSIYFYRSHVYFWIIKSSKNAKNYFSVLSVVCSFFFTYSCYKNITSIYQKSDYLLNFSLGTGFTTLKICSLLIYCLFFMAFFLAIHINSTLFLRINKYWEQAIFRWAYGFLLGIILLTLLDAFRWIYPLTGIYFLLVYVAKYPRYLYRFRYRTSLYFFLGAFVFTCLTISVVNEQEQLKDLFRKERFGVRYLSENDLIGEGLLAKVTQTISQDTAIIDAFNSSALMREKIQHLIKVKHLDLYFDHYETEALAFDNNGNSVDNAESQNLNFYKTTYQNKAYKTPHDNIFFVNNANNNFLKQYITFIPVTQNGISVGEIVLNLTLKTEFVESVYQELLMSKNNIQEPESRNYSYAIFNENNRLLYNNGNFNYERKLSANSLLDNELYIKGKLLNNYHHVGIKGENGKKIVVSSKDNSYRNLFSNFSFLFLILIVSIVFIMTLYAIKYGFSGFNINYSTKIQLYLNTAYLLPLFLIVFITLTVIYTAFNNNQEKTYLDNSKNIASTVKIYFENFNNKRISRPFLEQEIANLAHDTRTDINFYDINGKLNLTTRPLVFDYNLQAPYINPEAFSRIIEQRESETILSESLEQLHYKAVYLGIKDYNGKLMGVMEVPFFDSKLTLDRQILDVISTILSIFVIIFVLLLIVSYYASTILTKPLRMVIQKLKRTTLEKPNEPLEWKSDDEIGLLVKEYNKLVSKLQESRMALSQSEKQSAWREMAKQVAHEIKNPLTPMKLSIQQLQRTLPTDNPAARERIERTLNSLTEQIDNISNIANSFSEFAKMPVLTNDSFDIVPVLQKTVDLYNEQDNIFLNFHLKGDNNLVIGDRQFISRVLTNLILNGIQAVPQNRKPEIYLRAYKNTEENFMVIEVQDNGKGISEDIREKVFSPNFSTKSGGSGLGLAMARRGIEQAGGNIWFESNEEEGTTFFVQLLLAERK